VTAATTLPAPSVDLDAALDVAVGASWQPVGNPDATTLARRCVKLLREGAAGDAWYEGELACRLVKRGLLAFSERLDPARRTDRLVLTEKGSLALILLEGAVSS